MTPLVRASLAFAAGIVVGLRIGPGHGTLVAACAVLAALSALFAGRGRFRASPSAEGRPGGGWPGRAFGTGRPIALFAALGVVAGATASLGVRADCRTALPDGATIGVRGTLEGAPSPGGTAWFRLESIRVRGREMACSGAVRVRLPPRASVPPLGAVLAGTGVWWAFPRSTSWPLPPERSGTLGLRSLRAVEDGGIAKVFSTARGHAQRRVRALFPRHSGLAEALVLAGRGGIDAEVKQDFTTLRGKREICLVSVDFAVYSRVISVLACVPRSG